VIVVAPSFTAVFFRVSGAADLFFLAAVVCASAGIVFYVNSPVRTRETAFLLFLLALSLLAGVRLSSCFENIPLFRSPFYTAGGFSGVAAADSRPVSGGMKVVPVDIKVIDGVDTVELSDRGRCRMFFSGTDDYFKGQKIFVGKKMFLRGDASNPVLYTDGKYIQPAGWTDSLHELRARMIAVLDKKISLLDTDTADLFRAFFTGRKTDPSRPVFTGFVRSGASHVLALSGMHLGIIAGFLFIILRPVSGKSGAFWISQPVLLFYLFLTGASPSLQRAYLFLLCAGCVWIFAGVPDPLHILSFVFVVHLLIDPSAGNSLSFKLSYAALAGIFLFGKTAWRMLPGFIPSGVRTVMSASFAAQAATLPLAVYYFGTVYTAGIVSSVVLVPAVSVFVVTGLLYLVSPVPVSEFLSLFMNLISLVLRKSTDFFSSFPSYRITGEMYLRVSAYTVLILTLIFLVEYLLYIKKRSSAGDDGYLNRL